jgi:hypothetical protein
VGSAWKILPVTARSPEITHLNTLNRAFLTVSVFGHLEFACTGGRSPKPRHGIFKDMIFRTWDPQFLETWSLHSGFPRPKKTWEILGYGFQDMVFTTWDLNFGAWEILGYGFQDMVFKTWDLNFGA